MPEEMDVTRRRIGTTDLMVSPLCLGGNVFGWTLDEAGSFAVLDAYVDGGGNFIDTADVYATWEPVYEGGISEQIIGSWLKRRGRRDDVVIATKVGQEMGPGMSGLGAGYVQRAIDASLQRLGVDHVDLLYAHIDDEESPLEETLEAFDAAVTAGKVRVVGASNYTADRFARALELGDDPGRARYEALQPEFNLIDRAGYAGLLEELCEREQIGVMPYFALASGFLTGKYRRDQPFPETQRAQEVQETYLDDGRGWPVLDALLAVSERRGATPSQVALAWLMQRPSITAPIASATSPEQVRELLDATRVELDEADREELDAAGEPAATPTQ
jgi:aryl-alcohol dehydrogenase-like predicted oxidoreductase